MAKTNDVKLLPSTVVEKLEEAGITRNSLIFFQNDRWVYQVKDTPINASRCYQEIDTLGPFDVHEVDVSLVLYPSTSEYSITRIGTRNFSNAEHMKSVYAPIVPITLEGGARTTANIPNNATHFCWLYPLHGIFNNENVTLDDEYGKNLLNIDGFAYFTTAENKNDILQLVRVNSLTMSTANGIDFDGPYKWPEEFTEQLWRQNRFQPVTLPDLFERGIRYFAFINPYESITSENGKTSWIPSPHGAFAYLFNEDHSQHEFDCYFTVTDDLLGVSPESERA